LFVDSLPVENLWATMSRGMSRDENKFNLSTTVS